MLVYEKVASDPKHMKTLRLSTGLFVYAPRMCAKVLHCTGNPSPAPGMASLRKIDTHLQVLASRLGNLQQPSMVSRILCSGDGGIIACMFTDGA